MQEEIPAKNATSAQHNPDAMLNLYHSLSGQALTASVMYPPVEGASKEEWDEWRKQAQAEIKLHAMVPPKTVESIVNAFQDVRSPRRLLYACASCGCRRADTSDYKPTFVHNLPEVFQLTAEQLAAREALGTVDLLHIESKCNKGGSQEEGQSAQKAKLHPSVSEDGGSLGDVVAKPCDLRRLVSCFEHNDGKMYHLYPHLVQQTSTSGEVDESGEDGGVGCSSPREPFVMLCPSCSRGVCDEKAPKCSLAEGTDFGSLDALYLPEPSALERLVLADCRPYGTVIKVVASTNRNEPRQQRLKLKGHWITFTHNGPREVSQLLMKSVASRVHDVRKKVKVHLLGPSGSHDVLFKRLQNFGDMALRPTVVLNHLRVRLAVQRVAYYRDRLLADHSPDELPSIDELTAQFGELVRQLSSDAVRDTNLDVEEVCCSSPTRAPSLLPLIQPAPSTDSPMCVHAGAQEGIRRRQ